MNIECYFLLLQNVFNIHTFYNVDTHVLQHNIVQHKYNAMFYNAL